MVDISVIIVSYNVRVFLEQALYAVLSSAGGLSIEIIVVDNNSTDGSIEYLEAKLSGAVTFIQNNTNLGFSKANNQGIRIAKGKYTLLLNPDTVVQADTLNNCYKFAETNETIGAIGVRMVDGRGQYLAESKRSIPTPASSFWKLSGVSKLFPKSKYFSAYNLGHINSNTDAQTEVLCGAFMFMPTKVLEEVGLLDEDYFMYGEDIDLSYRIGKAGYEIWYLGSNAIIHYKGQSTKKSSLSYVNTFYNAMSIFVTKHLDSNKALLFFISLAIWVRSLGSFTKRILRSLLPMALDAIGFYIGLQAIKHFWASYRFDDPEYYVSSSITYNIITYVIIWLLVFWVGRSYKQYHNYKIYFINFLIGFLLVLVVYSLLPIDYRTSRALIILGAIWVLLFGIVIRFIIGLFGKDKRNETKRIGIVGHQAEYDRAKSIVHKSLGKEVFTTHINANNYTPNNLKSEKEINQLSEIVFCIKDIPLDTVLNSMSKDMSGLTYKIIGDKSLNIIGSRRSNELGEVYGLDISYQIETEANNYYKRLIDIGCSMILICLYPLLYLMSRFNLKISFFGLIKVLIGKLTMIGYIKTSGTFTTLPEIKEGLIEISPTYSEESRYELNTNYALHYSPFRDVVILFNHIF